MAIRKNTTAAKTKRHWQRSDRRDEWGHVPWVADAAAIQSGLVDWWAQVITGHPDLYPEVEAAKAWLWDRITAIVARECAGESEQQIEREATRALHEHWSNYRGVAPLKAFTMDWLMKRYPRLHFHPDYITKQTLDNALAAVLTGTTWAGAGSQLIEHTTINLRTFKHGAHAQVWVARFSGQGIDASPVPWPADDLGALELVPEVRLWHDDTPLYAGAMRTVFVLTGNPNFTRAELHAALDRACAGIEELEGSGYSLSKKRGPKDDDWRHLPALYRLRRRYPDLAMEHFTDLVVNDNHSLPALNHEIGDSAELQHWIKARPTSWHLDTSEDTVGRHVNEAITWLGPEARTPSHPTWLLADVRNCLD